MEMPALAAEVGPSEAARRTGLPLGTIKTWRHKTGQSGPPPGADVAKWRANKREDAREAWETSKQALARVRELLDAGKTADAQRASLVFAICADKSGGFEAAAVQQEEQAARLDHEAAELLVAVFKHFFDAVGLPFGPDSPARGALAAMLRQADAGQPISAPGPESTAAHAEIRREVGSELRAEIEAELRERIEPEWRAEHRGLPAAGETEALEESDLVEPQRVVRVTPPEPEEEVADGEVAAASRARSQRRGYRTIADDARYRARYGESEFS